MGGGGEVGGGGKEGRWGGGGEEEERRGVALRAQRIMELFPRTEFHFVTGQGLLFVPKDEPEYTAEYAREIMFSLRTLCYLVGTFLFVGWSVLFQRKLPKGDNRRGLSLGVTGGRSVTNELPPPLFREGDDRRERRAAIVLFTEQGWRERI